MTSYSLDRARQPVDRAEMHRILDQLLDLRERTDPTVCTDPSTVPMIDPPPKTCTMPDGTEAEVLEVQRGKDNAAGWAMSTAGNLLVGLVGWAINHKVGQALSNPKADPNQHDHEMVGETAACPGAGGLFETPEAARGALLAAMWSFDSALPFHLRVELRASMKALDMGEVRPLVRPVVTGHHGNAFSLLEAKKLAVEVVHFRIGKGARAKAAYDAVATALNQSPKTIQNWDLRDLPRMMGEDEARKLKEDARKAGEYAVKYEANSAWKEGKTVDFLIDLRSQHLADVTLAHLAEVYRDALEGD